MDSHRPPLIRLMPGRALPGAARSLLLAAPASVFLALFFGYPLVSILGLGLAPGGRPDLSALGRVLTDPSLLGIAGFTVWQAALSTVLTVAAALPASYVLARYRFPGKGLVRALSTVPFVLPPVVVGAAFIALLGARSPLRHSLAAILLAHVFFNYAVVLRIVGGLWSELDPRMEDAARTLGAGGWAAFRRVTWPLLRPAVAAAASLVFLFSFTSFGIILILGGPGIVTLEVEIYRQTAQLLNLPVAAGLALVQLAAVAALLVLSGRYSARTAGPRRLRPRESVERSPRTMRERLVVGMTFASMALLLLPIAVLVERSLATAGGHGPDHYLALVAGGEARSAFADPLEALRNSLGFALLAVVISVPVGLSASAFLASRTSGRAIAFDTLLALPLGTSAVTVGFGFIVALDRPPLDLRSHPLLIPIAHAVVAVPFVVRATLPHLRSVDRRLREAAQTLGASPARAWREIDLPIIGRAVGVGAAFAFAISLGEFGATVFIARPDVTTLPLAIFRSLARPGADTFGMAMAMSTALMLVAGAAVLVIERFRAPGRQSF